MINASELGTLSLGGVVAVSGWLIRAKIRSYDEHLKECSEIPKKLILERIDSLERGVETVSEEIGEVRADIRTLTSHLLDRRA